MVSGGCFLLLLSLSLSLSRLPAIAWHWFIGLSVGQTKQDPGYF